MPYKKHMHNINLKFNYNVPIKESVGNEGDFLIAGTAIRSTLTSNNHKFIGEELKKSADTLKGVPILVDHRNEVSAIKGRVIASEFDDIDEKVDFKGRISDDEIKRLIKRGDLNSVSIGATVKELEEADDGVFIPRDIQFRELSLVAVPADEGATFNVALQEAYDKVKSDFPKNIDYDEDDEELDVDESHSIDKKEVKMTEEETKSETEETTPAPEAPEEPQPEPEPAPEEAEEAKVDEQLKKARVALKQKELEKLQKQLKEADSDEEPKEEPEPAPEEADEPEVSEKYKIVSGYGSIRGGSFTVVRT
jgi:phage head maturation protease